ncbi:MAG: hypothetical protein HY088_02760 [Ignavibacteriales bacterium]|nr:hypothetical protein [Ignavibacteriales bacterium]
MDFSRVMAYAVSAVTFVMGALVLAGLFIHETVPKEFRITFGVVLVLMGIYRFAITKTKETQAKKLEKE